MYYAIIMYMYSAWWLLTIKLVGVQITGQLALLPLLLFNVWLCLQGVV